MLDYPVEHQWIILRAMLLARHFAIALAGLMALIWIAPAYAAAPDANAAAQASGGNAVSDPGSDAPANAADRRNRADVEYYESYYSTLRQLNEVTVRNFKWQDRAREVVLWLVVFVVVSGIAMSAFQLWVALSRNAPIGETTLEGSPDKFRVTTSVAGVSILVISIAFLYLFLREVYRIEMVDVGASPPQTARPQMPAADVRVRPDQPCPAAARCTPEQASGQRRPVVDAARTPHP